MKSQVLHTVWCHISCEAAGEFWHWSLSGVKGLTYVKLCVLNIRNLFEKLVLVRLCTWPTSPPDWWCIYRNPLVAAKAALHGQNESIILAGLCLSWSWLSWYPPFQYCIIWSRIGQRIGAKVSTTPCALEATTICQIPRNQYSKNSSTGKQMVLRFEGNYLCSTFTHFTMASFLEEDFFETALHWIIM